MMTIEEYLNIQITDVLLFPGKRAAHLYIAISRHSYHSPTLRRMIYSYNLDGHAEVRIADLSDAIYMSQASLDRY